MARLRKLEGVVQSLGKNIDDEGGPAEVGQEHDAPAAAADGETDGGLQQLKTEKKVPKNCGLFNGPDPQTSGTNGVVTEFGRLVVDEGRSRYVSNKFWNSMSEEVSEVYPVRQSKKLQLCHIRYLGLDNCYVVVKFGPNIDSICWQPGDISSS